MRNASPDSRWIGIAVAALVPVLLGVACGQRSADSSGSAVAYGTDTGGSAKAQLFTVPADQMSHIQVITLEPAGLRRTLRLTGSVAYNSFETTPVITQVGGPVSRIMVSPGDVVEKGQALLEVSSPDYAQARTNFLKARDALSLAQTNFERAQDLYAHHVVAQADVQQTESVRNQAQADLQASEQALKVLGISDPDALAKGPVSAEIPLRAPIGGEVVERLVAPGQLVQAGATQCFTISDMRTVWVLANVYQQDLTYVHAGDPVEITTDAYPTVFRGRISYIAPAVDPTTRTLQVRIVTQNPERKLKKDMYVTASVRAAVIPKVIAVPDAAILRTAENQPFVYVEVGVRQFGERLVAIGESQGGRTEITSGLKAGENVVADGSLFLQFANSLQR